MTWRADFERRSVGPLHRLSALPRWLILLGVIGVLMVGLIADGAVGGLTLTLLALFLGWLLTLSWPTLDLPSRLLRLAVLAGLVAVAASRF